MYCSFQPEKRRIKLVKISSDLLVLALLKLDGSRLVKCEGLPLDSKSVGMWIDEKQGYVHILVESRDFPEVDIDKPYPWLDVAFKEEIPETWHDRGPLL